MRAVGDRAIALGLHMLFRQHHLGASQFRLGARLRFFDVLGGELNGAVHLLHLEAELRLDFELAQLALLGDLGGPGLPLAFDARFFGGDHCRLARLGRFRVARRPDLLDLEMLVDLRFFFLLGQDEPLLGGLELGLPHRNLGIGLDLRALLAVDGDDLRELAQPDRVERVVLVERRKRRLVEPRQRYGVEQNAVLLEIVAQQIGDIRDKLGAPLVQAVHGMTRRHCLHGVDETAFEQIANAVDRERLGAERLRGRGNAFGRRDDPHVKLKLDIDPHAIFGDHRFVAGTTDLDAQRAHVDLFDLVQKRKRETAAGDENALAAETGPHQGDVARRLAIEAVEKQDRNRDHHDRDGDG